jgi:hypothetical protein
MRTAATPPARQATRRAASSYPTPRERRATRACAPARRRDGRPDAAATPSPTASAEHAAWSRSGPTTRATRPGEQGSSRQSYARDGPPGVRRRFAPHQLRHAHAVELAHEGVPLNVIQAATGAYQPRRHLDLSPGHRQRRDHRHRPRPQGTDDPRQHRTPHLSPPRPAVPSKLLASKTSTLVTPPAPDPKRPWHRRTGVPGALLRGLRWHGETAVSNGV